MSTEGTQERLTEAVQNARIWKSFMEHPGWELFSRIVKEQETLRIQTVLRSPIDSVGGAFSQEFYKGEIQALGLVLVLPAAQLELSELDAKSLATSLELEKDNATRREYVEPSRVDSDDAFGS